MFAGRRRARLGGLVLVSFAGASAFVLLRPDASVTNAPTASGTTARTAVSANATARPAAKVVSAGPSSTRSATAGLEVAKPGSSRAEFHRGAPSGRPESAGPDSATQDARRDADRALAALRAALSSRSPEGRARGLEELALVALELSKDARRPLVDEALGTATSALDDLVRETALSSLVLLDHERETRVEEALERLSCDSRESASVRRAVAEVLACYPGEHAALGLHTLAKDPDVGVRIAAFFALATSRPDEAVIALEAVLASDPEETIRQAAREALAVATAH